MKHVQRGVAWNGYFRSGTGWEGQKPQGAIAFKGETFEAVDPPPFPLPPAENGEWSVDLNCTTAETLYLRQGSAIYRYRAGETHLTKIFDENLKAGTITEIASDGTLLGVRGQDYLIARPGETRAKLLPIPVQPAPRAPHFLRIDDRGRLWGGPMFGQTLFSVDLNN